tara:strand:+ start:925 stop:1101 length:177 start_codon:yes stop_codon:yes gene_type:complete
MLFRTINNVLIEIKRENFLTDKEYYDKILSIKINNYKKNELNCVKNILSTLLYEEKYK